MSKIKHSKIISAAIAAFIAASAAAAAFFALPPRVAGADGTVADKFAVGDDIYTTLAAALDAVNSSDMYDPVEVTTIEIGYSGDTLPEELVVGIGSTLVIKKPIRLTGEAYDGTVILRRGSGFTGAMFSIPTEVTPDYDPSELILELVTVDGAGSYAPVISGGGYALMSSVSFLSQGQIAESGVGIEFEDTCYAMLNGGTPYGSLDMALTAAENGDTVSFDPYDVEGRYVDFSAPLTLSGSSVTLELGPTTRIGHPDALTGPLITVADGATLRISADTDCSLMYTGEFTGPFISVGSGGTLSYVAGSDTQCSVTYESMPAATVVECRGTMTSEIHVNYNNATADVYAGGSYSSTYDTRVESQKYDGIRFQVTFDSPGIAAALPEAQFCRYSETLELPSATSDYFDLLYWRQEIVAPPDPEYSYYDAYEELSELTWPVALQAVWTPTEWPQFTSSLPDYDSMTYGDTRTYSVEVTHPAVTAGDVTVACTWGVYGDGVEDLSDGGTSFSISGYPAGQYTVVVTASLVSGDAVIEYVDDPPYSEMELTVERRTLTVKAKDVSVTYGDTVPGFETEITGFVSGESEATLEAEDAAVALPVCPDAAGAVPNAGTYTIEFDGQANFTGSKNYIFSYQNGTLTVGRAPVTFTAPSVTSFTYSAAEQGPLLPEGSGYTITGELSAVNAGRYSATVALTDRTNTEWSTGGDGDITVEWTIAKAALTVTADDRTVTFGSPAPAYTCRVTGFLGADTEASLTGSAVAASSYRQGSPVGTYSIVFAGYTSANYDINYADGTLTVTKLKIDAPAVSDTSFVYSGAAQRLQIAQSSYYSVSGNTQTAAGSYSAAVALTDRTNTEWSTGGTADLRIAWTISKAALNVAADSATAVYGDAAPAFTATVTGLAGNDTEASLGGTLVFTTGYTAGSNAGSYTVTPSGYTSGNYDITYTAGTLTVVRAKIDMSGVSFRDFACLFDRKPHTVVITGTLPSGVTVSYSPSNIYTGIGEYPVTASFACDTANYEEIPSMSAKLIIKDTGFVGSDEYNRIVERIKNTRSDHITNQTARKILSDRIDTFVSDAEKTISMEELMPLVDRFDGFLDEFVIDLRFSPLSVFKDRYYSGEKIESGFNLVGSMYREFSAIIISDCTIEYPHGDCFVTGDTSFKVKSGKLETEFDILPVLPYNKSGIILEPSVAGSRDLRAGDPLPAIGGTAKNAAGDTVPGVFAWAEGQKLRAGEREYLFTFVPEGETEPCYGTLKLSVRKGIPEVTSVRLAGGHRGFIYGDPLPELACESSVPGSIAFDVGQMLLVGEHGYAYTFTPDSEEYETVRGDFTLTAGKAPLIIEARDLLICEGDEPVFTFVFTGFVNVESSLLLTSGPTVENVPTEIGTYRVIPGGAVSDNYEITYRESEFTVRPRSYAAEITDDPDGITAEFRLDENTLLRVRTVTSGFDAAAFDAFVRSSGILTPGEAQKYLYELSLTDNDYRETGKAALIMLDIPSALDGYCIHILKVTDGVFSVYTDYETSDGKIYLSIRGSGTYCISAVPEDEILVLIRDFISDTDTDPENVWRVKMYYDLLPESGRKKLSDNELAALDSLFGSSTGKLVLIREGENGITVDGLGNVTVNELLDISTERVEVGITSSAAGISDSVKAALRESGLEIAEAFELGIYKTVCVSGKESSSYTELVGSNDIKGRLKIGIPVTGRMRQFSGLCVRLIGDGGVPAEVAASVEKIGDKEYLVFETDRLSTCVIAGVPAADAAVRDKAGASWAIILSFGAAATAVAVPGYVIKRKEERRTGE